MSPSQAPSLCATAAAGLLELPADAPVGQDLREYLARLVTDHRELMVSRLSTALGLADGEESERGLDELVAISEWGFWQFTGADAWKAIRTSGIIPIVFRPQFRKVE